MKNILQKLENRIDNCNIKKEILLFIYNMYTASPSNYR